VAPHLAGLSAFPITPLAGRGDIDAAGLARLVARAVAGGAQSIGLMGSSGSYPYLPRAARIEAMHAARAAAPGVPIAVGVGAPALLQVLKNARDAAECGMDAILLAPVTYQPLRPAEVTGLYRAVAAEAALPVVLYNNPGTTHVTFGHDQIAEIAALPGVVSVKMPPDPNPGPAFAALRAALPASCTLGTSGDGMAARALRAGAEVWYSVLGGLFPEPCRAMVDAAAAGDDARLDALDARLAPVWQVFAAQGSYRAIHAAHGIMGFGEAPPPLPVLPLAGADRAAVAAALRAAELTA
jgi:4-hydroxy-tetrahydrodipicolinate synthase